MRKYLFRGVVTAVAMAAVTIAVSCADDGNDGASGGNGNGGTVKYELSDVVKVFGFDGQNRYAYCPSVMATDDMTHMWFCGNPDENVFVDNIYHVTVASDGTVSAPVSVLQPGGPGEWDSQHVCDPSVVRGEFAYGGHTYSYAMFYLGSSLECYYNEIGVAFADDPDATEWVKYDRQLVSKTWTGEGDQDLGNGAVSWGVGQPSAFSVDGRGGIILTYTVGDRDGTRVVWSQCDLSDMSAPSVGAPRKLVTEGFWNLSGNPDYTRNMDFVYDPVKSTVYAVRPLNPCPASYPSYIGNAIEVASITYTNFKNGFGGWARMLRVDSSVTGFPRTHNAALERDGYGQLFSDRTLDVYYTVSKASPDVEPSDGMHAEWTYDIYRGTMNLE